MGTSYDAAYFYGAVFDNDDYDCGLPESLKARLLEDGLDDDDLEEWICAHILGVPHYWRPDMTQEERTAGYRDCWSQREAKCMEIFGIGKFEVRSLGFYEYSQIAVLPRDAWRREYRCARVRPFTTADMTKWGYAMNKLRDWLPELSEPGLFYGCVVG